MEMSTFTLYNMYRSRHLAQTDHRVATPIIDSFIGFINLVDRGLDLILDSITIVKGTLPMQFVMIKKLLKD